MNIKFDSAFVSRLEQTDCYLQSLDLSQCPAGVASGNMGLCLYFYYLAEWKNDDRYRHSADRLMKQLFASAGAVSAIDFCDGLAGIAWCILHFLQKGWVDGRPDEVLREADNAMYRTLHFEWLADEKRSRSDYLGLLFYLVFRLPAIRSREDRLLMEKTGIALVNRLENSFAEHPWQMWKGFHLYRAEPMLYLFILSRLYALGIYQFKIRKIWESMSDRLLATIPTLHANRLLWSLGMEQVLACVEMPGWRGHVRHLRETTDLHKAVREEFLNKNVTLTRGVAGLALLLLLGKNPVSGSDIFPEIIRKIETSDIWNERFCLDSHNFLGNIDLFGGYTGTALIYHKLQQMYLSTEERV